MAAAQRLYLDHAATSAMVPQAIDAMVRAMGDWANPSSPHADGRAARAALEAARKRIGAALGWEGAIIFTSGASEAIAIALGRGKARANGIMTSPVEHDAVLRVTPDAARLAVDGSGIVQVDAPSGALYAIQHANNETGVIQPIDDMSAQARAAGGLLFADCAQSAGKLPLPDADMIAISAHKFGGPPGAGALLVRDLTLLEPSGGQEQGYRAGTENLPAILGMAAALEGEAQWMTGAVRLRARLDEEIEGAGGIIVAQDAHRIATIGSYRMPGLSARAQLIRFDLAGISVSAGSACSSGTLKTSHVLRAMGWDERAAGEVVRVSFGPKTCEADIARFVDVWRAMRP